MINIYGLKNCDSCRKASKWLDNNSLDYNFYDFKNVTFYSDSMNDFPLLLAANKPIAVNPDNKLREECKKRSWEIIDLP